MSKQENLAKLLNEAFALHQQGQLEQAQSICKKILRKSPNQPDVLHFLGVMEAQNKRFDTALGLFRRALTFDPKNAIAHANYGNALLESGRQEDALASYDRALTFAPDDVDVLVNRGNALLELRTYEPALASYDRALKLDRGNATAWMNRGIVLCELKLHEEAIASYDCALAAAPQYAMAHYNREWCCVKSGGIRMQSTAMTGRLRRGPITRRRSITAAMSYSTLNGMKMQ